MNAFVLNDGIRQPFEGELNDCPSMVIFTPVSVEDFIGLDLKKKTNSDMPNEGRLLPLRHKLSTEPIVNWQKAELSPRPGFINDLPTSSDGTYHETTI